MTLGRLKIVDSLMELPREYLIQEEVLNNSHCNNYHVAAVWLNWGIDYEFVK